MEIKKKAKNIVSKYNVRYSELVDEYEISDCVVDSYRREYLAREEADRLNKTLENDLNREFKRYYVEEVFVESKEEQRPNNYVNLDDVVAKKDICGIIRETYWTEGMSLAHVTVDGKAKPHSHDSDEAYYIIKGKGHLTIDGRKDYVEMGDTIGIPKGSSHFIEGKLELLVINHPGFNPAIIREG